MFWLKTHHVNDNTTPPLRFWRNFFAETKKDFSAKWNFAVGCLFSAKGVRASRGRCQRLQNNIFTTKQPWVIGLKDPLFQTLSNKL